MREERKSECRAGAYYNELHRVFGPVWEIDDLGAKDSRSYYWHLNGMVVHKTGDGYITRSWVREK